MKDRPILMSDPMVRAILDGTKTQTRRVVKSQPQPNGGIGLHPVKPYQTTSGGWTWVLAATRHGSGGNIFTCPYGDPGDRLYVKEAWRTSGEYNMRKPRELPDDAPIEYIASTPYDEARLTGRYRHARFMMRWMSRITLEIEDVRVERLQEIGDRDVLAEGCVIPEKPAPYRDACGELVLPHERTASDVYRALWESINGPSSWALNPWVWVVSFRRIEAGR